MSADNGIYILKTKDHQYRIAHILDVNDLHFSLLDCSFWEKKFVPSRIVETFGDLRFTRNEYKAYQIAHKWAEVLPTCEYGVNLLTYNKAWKQILIDGQEYAKKELKYSNDEILKKIASGYYLDEWLKREKYYKELKEKAGVKDAV